MASCDGMDGLGGEVLDPYDEVFDLFSNYSGSKDLGMLEPRAKIVEVGISGRDLTLHQSPGILTSNRDGGTTGAVVWRISIPFAEWMSSTTNILFQRQILTASSTVLELGAGVGAVGLALFPHISRYIFTDQEYVMKLLQKNIEENSEAAASGVKLAKGRKSAQVPLREKRKQMQTLVLDWETSDVSDIARLLEPEDTTRDQVAWGIDAVVACDCVFNEALVEPFVQACTSICGLRRATGRQRPTVCVIAQQLRSPDVFEHWLGHMSRHFRVWRLSGEDMSSDSSLGDAGEYVVHLAILRCNEADDKGKGT